MVNILPELLTVVDDSEPMLEREQSADEEISSSGTGFAEFIESSSKVHHAFILACYLYIKTIEEDFTFMTHYMGLLVANQPWNLIIFMAIPVILAETLAVTELAILFTKNLTGAVRKVNRIAGILVGFYFLGIFIYLWGNAVVPITASREWRGIADIVAVGFYLSGIIPLLGISLLEVGAIGRKRDPMGKLKLHATFVGIFLVVAHIAMIFGMMDPKVLGYAGAGM